MLIKVVRNGRMIREIERPVRTVAGRRVVTYKGQQYALKNGSIELSAMDSGEQKSLATVSKASVVKAEKKATVMLSATGVRDAGNPSPMTSDALAAEDICGIPENWDPRQLEVISAPAADRLLVDAGPGTGKTAVACRRVAALIDDQGITPGNIWLISFTRTAVKEIRLRMRHYLQDQADAHSVKIATIDSQAWAIHSGFDPNASLSGSYEENIESVSQLVRMHAGVFEYLADVEHVIIDEAQDIVGVRAELLTELLKRLGPGSGVTVFSDEAQAIYGFADDDVDSQESQKHLPARLREQADLRFREVALAKIYRTDRARLQKLFTEVRSKVLGQGDEGESSRLESVTAMVRGLADKESAVWEELEEVLPDDLRKTFVLFRRRIDVLTAASLWGKELRPHRLRMSGLPTLIEPWLGAMLWDYRERVLSRSAFVSLWDSRIEQKHLSTLDEYSAWELLVRLAGESQTIVLTKVLRAKLARAARAGDLVRTDFGLGGPIFGTIHGCKGREADVVLLMLPQRQRSNSDVDEEARVVFVGATRAKLELRVGKGFKFIKSRRTDTGRAFALQTRNGAAAAQVEIGREGDMTFEGVAGLKPFATAGDARQSHEQVLNNVSSIIAASAMAVPGCNWRYRISTGDGQPLAYLAETINKDLFDVGREVKKDLGWYTNLRPSNGLSHLRMFGASTLVLHPDDPQGSLLHEPWATSGFAIAPVIQGFDMVYFRSFRTRNYRGS